MASLLILAEANAHELVECWKKDDAPKIPPESLEYCHKLIVFLYKNLFRIMKPVLDPKENVRGTDTIH